MEERKNGRSSDEVVGEVPQEWQEDSLPPIDIPKKHEDPGPVGMLGLAVRVDGDPSGHDAMRRRMDRLRRDDHG